MKHILYIQPYASQVGGVDTVLLQLVEGLDRARYRAFVLLPGPSPYVAKYEAAGATVLFGKLAVFGKPTDLGYYLRNTAKLWVTIRTVMRVIREHKIDIVHSHKMELMGGNIAAKLMRIPAVQTVHELPRKPLFAYQMVGYLNHYFNDKVIVLCERSKVMFNWGSTVSHKLLKIYNGIDFKKELLPLGPGDIRMELGIPADAKIVIAVARLSPMKGMEYFIQAADLLRKQGRDCHFLIVGDVAFDYEKEYKQKLIDMAERFGLNGTLHFLGLRRDVPELLRQSDLFVLPSVYDIFPTVILEAMRAGLPVVATDVGGVPEMVRDTTGLLVPAENHEALAGGIASVLDADYRAMGENARLLVETEFSREAYVQKTTDIYEELWQSYEKYSTARSV
ncbi:MULTISPECIES: glycosyltransferase [Paenibacillus]|uniref:glycosyltransferase n=1 Tax=Paenibacillus TaxID=44249 RepID=UPI0022B868A9|nr:glycosyltransferase [Paenibacillus caseinilyticus]MCZ8519325.1 glycosyltransferase [Paenibacillus caseinilyticus]